MSDLKVQISDAQFKSLLSEAIFASMTTETRDMLIKHAVAGLLAKQTIGTGYSARTDPSVVEQTFARSVAEIGRETVRELVMNDPEIRPMAESLVRDTLLTMLRDERLSERIATVLWAALEKVDR